MSKWDNNPPNQDVKISTKYGRIPSFAELIRSCGSHDGSTTSKANYVRFGSHYNVKILPKENQPVNDLPRIVPEPQIPNSCESAHAVPENSASNDEIQHLTQNYIKETKKLICEFSKFEDNLKDGSLPRTFPQESIDQLANFHENVSRTLLDIRKSYRKKLNNTGKCNYVITKKDRLIKSHGSSSPNDHADHSVVAFTIKAVKPHSTMISEIIPKKNFLNKDLCWKTSILCSQCGITLTPEWRSGPSGSRSLCNACGLFYSKHVKKIGVARACLCLKKRKKIVSNDINND